MKTPTRTWVYLAAAVLVAAAAPVFAQMANQSSTQPPARPAPPTTTQGTAVAKPPEQPPTREGRPERERRRSRRAPASGGSDADESRPSRDAGPSRKELTFTANLLGGYDDNVVGGQGAGSGGTPTLMKSGATAYADAELNYYGGNQRRSFRMVTSGSLTAYPGNHDEPAPGGIASLDAKTTLGRATTLGVSERLSYDPFFTALAPTLGGGFAPEGGVVTVSTTLVERRSLSSNTGASLQHSWGRGDSLSLSYNYRQQEYTTGDRGDSYAHTAATMLRKRLGTGVKATAEYRYLDGENTDARGTQRPRTEQRIEGGLEVDRTVSRRRRFMLSVAGGSTHLESIGSIDRLPYDVWVPTGRGSILLALSPQWSIDGGYRRDFTLLQGITDEVYATDTGFINTGRVGARTSFKVGVTYSDWKTPVASGADDTLKTYGALVQASVLLTQTIGLSADYNFYHHRFANPGALPEGFPAEYDRHAVRVGLVLRVPLVGGQGPATPTPR